MKNTHKPSQAIKGMSSIETTDIKVAQNSKPTVKGMVLHITSLTQTTFALHPFYYLIAHGQGELAIKLSAIFPLDGPKSVKDNIPATHGQVKELFAKYTKTREALTDFDIAYKDLFSFWTSNGEFDWHSASHAVVENFDIWQLTEAELTAVRQRKDATSHINAYNEKIRILEKRTKENTKQNPWGIDNPWSNLKYQTDSQQVYQEGLSAASEAVDIGSTEYQANLQKAESTYNENNCYVCDKEVESDSYQNGFKDGKFVRVCNPCYEELPHEESKDAIGYRRPILSNRK